MDHHVQTEHRIESSGTKRQRHDIALRQALKPGRLTVGEAFHLQVEWENTPSITLLQLYRVIAGSGTGFQHGPDVAGSGPGARRAPHKTRPCPPPPRTLTV